MTTDQKKPEAVKEFKPIKKLSPFVSDPYNNRGGKGGNKGVAISNSGVKGGKKINVSGAKKGGSGGDR
jgi:hypothetical protein